MELKDLKDPRDREACERANRAASIHTQEFVHERADEREKKLSGLDRIKFDQKTENEFQKGL